MGNSEAIFVRTNCVDKSPIRILLVDDYEPWRRRFSTTLRSEPGVQVIGEASDGLEAVRKAEELQPDLILLDIGLPSLNGIEAARRIRRVSPASKIIFVSDHRSADIAEAALSTGASAYVVKSDVVELLPAVKAVFAGQRFVSRSLADSGLNGAPKQYAADHPQRNVLTFPQPQSVGTAHRHEVGFYSDDRFFLDDVTLFIASALKAGDSAIVVATEPHRNDLLSRLHGCGLEMDKAIEEGRYLALDAAEGISQFMINGVLDGDRFLALFESLIQAAAKAATSERRRVAVSGECVNLLWAQGNAEAAIQIEKLGNQLTQKYDLDILCGYSPACVESGMDHHIYQQICAEHSAVYSR